MNKNPKISVVTITMNSARTLQDCINSVANQSYKDIEYIVIDGASEDDTLQIISNNLKRVDIFVTEQDEGIYDALNKGFKMANGDIIGILHSDDYYYENSVLDRVAKEFEDPAVDYVYGDIQMINDQGHQVRYWRAGVLKNGKISSTQIPHPSIFLSKKLLQKLSPPFDSSYRISADLKQQLIFANILNSKGVYIPLPLVKMRIGGTSTKSFRAYIDGWRESRRAWNEVSGSGGGLYVIKKVFSKINGFLLG
jgi:glycosyltransferase involved in cell wall biosynthesis